MPVAAVNIIGPDGTLLLAGKEIPPDWDGEVVANLLETGGAAETPIEAKATRKRGRASASNPEQEA